MSGGIIEALIARLERVEGELASLKKPAAGLVTIADYAEARSISRSTVRAAIREGRLPATKIGAAVRVVANAEIGRPVAIAKTNAATPASRADRILGIAGGRR